MPYVPRRKPAARHATTRRRAPAAKAAVKPRAKAGAKSAAKPKQQPRQKPVVRTVASVFTNGIRNNDLRSAASAMGAAKAFAGDFHEERRRDDDNAERSGLAGPRIWDVPSDNAGFPARKFVKFNYFDNLNISCAASTIGQIEYRANGMFDPYVAFGGHSPRYFQTFLGPNNSGAPYQNFRVHGCYVELTFVNTVVSDDEVIVFMHWRNNNASQLGGLIDIGEAPNTISTLLGMGAGTPPVTMSKYIKIAPILGIEELEDDETTAGDYQGDPLQSVRFDVGGFPAQGAETATFICNVCITYYAELFMQNFPVAS